MRESGSKDLGEQHQNEWMFDLNSFFALLIVVIGIGLVVSVRAIVHWLDARAKKTSTKWDDILIAAIGKPVQVAIGAGAITLSLTVLGILPLNYPGQLDENLTTSFWIVIGAWIVSSFLHNIVVSYGLDLAKKYGSEWNSRLIDLLERLIKWMVWFGAGMLILRTFEIDITPFLAGAGIAGLAVALAAQDILSNFFGGAIIALDRPFAVGDRIKVDQYYGDVIKIGARSTRIKTLDSQIVTIPNNKITSNIIANYSEPDEKLKIAIPVSVAYGSDPATVKQILREIAQDTIENTVFLMDNPIPTVFFLEFGDSHLKFVLSVWARKYSLSDEVKDAISTRIYARFAEAGIEIPYPHMVVHLRKGHPPGSAS